jgi:hypothetical protein
MNRSDDGLTEKLKLASCRVVHYAVHGSVLNIYIYIYEYYIFVEIKIVIISAVVEIEIPYHYNSATGWATLVRIPARATYFSLLQNMETGSRTHPTFYVMGNGCSLPRGKVAEL